MTERGDGDGLQAARACGSTGGEYAGMSPPSLAAAKGGGDGNDWVDTGCQMGVTKGAIATWMSEGNGRNWRRHSFRRCSILSPTNAGWGPTKDQPEGGTSQWLGGLAHAHRRRRPSRERDDGGGPAYCQALEPSGQGNWRTWTQAGNERASRQAGERG